MKKVLLLDTGTQGFAMIQSLHKLGHYIGLVHREFGNYADLSHYVDKKYYIGIKKLDEKYLQFLVDVIHKDGYQALIPMSDHTAEFVSKYKENLKSLIAFKMPDYSSFLKGYDKNKLMSLCEEKSYPHPKTIDLTGKTIDDLNIDSLMKFPYPAMLKPNLTTGGRGMRVINCLEELLQMYPDIRKDYGECHLQQFIQTGGRQVKLQLYVDSNQELICSSVMDKVRWYPVKGGASCCSVSIREDNMVRICHNILKDIKWEGFADFDTIGDPVTGQLLIMEINPRVPACIRTAIVAGVNWGEIILDGYLGNPVKKYIYKEGVSLRHLGFDVLWFLHSSKRFSVKPSWFSFFGSNVYYQDFILADQKPFWVGTLNNIKKLFDSDFRKDKQGV